MTEVLLILPLYLTLSFIWWQFQHQIKIMSDVENMLNNIVDTPKEGIKHHKRQKFLRDVTGSGKA